MFRGIRGDRLGLFRDTGFGYLFLPNRGGDGQFIHVVLELIAPDYRFCDAIGLFITRLFCAVLST